MLVEISEYDAVTIIGAIETAKRDVLSQKDWRESEKTMVLMKLNDIQTKMESVRQVT